jgi:hypothetical protein
LIGNIQHLFVYERNEQWLLHVAVLVGRCSQTLAANLIALILQSLKLTSLCCSAVYRFCWVYAIYCLHHQERLRRNILLSKFYSFAQGTTCITFNIKPYLYTVSVLSLHYKPAPKSAPKLVQYSCDFYGNLPATQERMHQSEVGFVEGLFAQVS